MVNSERLPPCHRAQGPAVTGFMIVSNGDLARTRTLPLSVRIGQGGGGADRDRPGHAGLPPLGPIYRQRCDPYDPDWTWAAAVRSWAFRTGAVLTFSVPSHDTQGSSPAAHRQHGHPRQRIQAKRPAAEARSA